MIEHLNTSGESLHNRHSKDNKFLDQSKKVFNEFFKGSFTMKMVSEQTGVDRANICRYLSCYRKADTIKAIKKGTCPITKHQATFWTTNPSLFPKEAVQLSIFSTL